MIEKRVIFHGMVQGVGFRETVRRAALHFHLVGWVRNLSDGSVEALVQGDDATIDAFIQAIKDHPRGAKIRAIKSEINPLSPPLLDFTVQ